LFKAKRAMKEKRWDTASKSLGSVLSNSSFLDYVWKKKVFDCLIECYKHTGDFINLQKILEEYKELIEAIPEDSSSKMITIYNLGSVCKGYGMYEIAEENFNKVLELIKNRHLIYRKRSYEGGAHFHLGEICQKKGRKDKAIFHYNRCLKIMPEHIKARESLRLLRKEV
jgi:tetratricopeptide (TPR) repeat protein